MGATLCCPACGAELRLEAAHPLPGEWARSGQRNFAVDAPAPPWVGAAAAPADFDEYERRMPARAASLESDVWVPAAQAGMSGLFGALAAGGACALLGWPWYIVPAAGLVATGSVWAWRLGAHSRLLWLVDRASRRVAPEPEPAPAQTVRVEFVEGSRVQFADLPEPRPGALRSLARAVNAGASFAEREAKAAGYSREMWEELRDIFVSRGWAAWRNSRHPQQGVELTVRGRAVLEQLAHSPTGMEVS